MSVKKVKGDKKQKNVTTSNIPLIILIYRLLFGVLNTWGDFMKDNSVVVMDNKMVKAKYGKLSDVESRFIFFAISQIKYNDTDFKTLKFSVGTLLRELEVPGKNYSRLFDVLKNVVEKSIVIPDEKGMSIFPWFQMARVEKSQNNLEMVEVQFNDLLRPYLLQLRQNFTKAELSIILNMKNHTRRIYLMCKQYLNIGHFEKDIAALHMELELGKVYKQYKYLARSIVEPAVEEINTLSDIRVSFKPIRVGKSYKKLAVNVWAVPVDNKAVGKKTAAEVKRIEDNRKKADAEYAENLAQSNRIAEEAAEKQWQEKCRDLELYLIRKTDFWEGCLNTIAATVAESTFHTWFVTSELFIDNQHNAYILVPNGLAANMINENYLNHIKEIFAGSKTRIATVKVVTPEIRNQFSHAVGVDELDEESVEEDLNQQPNFFQETEQTSLFESST